MKKVNNISTHITDDIILRLEYYYDNTNVDYILEVWLSSGHRADLLLQPEIDYIGVPRAITSIDSQDDSFIVHERYYHDIVNAMYELKLRYEEKFVEAGRN